MAKLKAELHIHTKMSRMRGMISPKELVKYAIEGGYDAIAVTDRGSLQAFPEVYREWKKYFRDYQEVCAEKGKKPEKGQFLKVVYGLEAYLTEGSTQIFSGGDGPAFPEECVILDPAIAGSAAGDDGRLRLLADKVKNGKITERFSMEDRQEKVLPAFFSFAGDAVLASYAPRDAFRFLFRACRTLGGSVKKEYFDLERACRVLMPELGRYAPEAVAEALDIGEQDGEGMYVGISRRLCDRMEEMGISTAGELNYLAAERVSGEKEAQRIPILIYVKNEEGLRNLYRLFSLAHREDREDMPELSRASLEESREGLLVGAMCIGGEISEGILMKKTSEELHKAASFYDFLEITPFTEHDTADGIYSLGREAGIPVILTSDAYYLNPEDRISYEILRTFADDREEGDPRPAHVKTPSEFAGVLSSIGRFGGDGKAAQAEQYLEESLRQILGSVEQVSPVSEERLFPNYPDAERLLNELCGKKARELYGETLPEEVEERLSLETEAICRNGYAGIFMIWRDLVQKSLQDGYPVGSRGAVSASFTAFLLDITPINPLDAHYRCEKCRYSLFSADRKYSGTGGADLPERICPVCGESLIRDGYSIPMETFFGAAFDREPDIDINFAPEEQSVVMDYVSALPGIGECCKAGTIATVSERTAEEMVRHYFSEAGREIPSKSEADRITAAISGVRRADGEHPGGMIVFPEGEEADACTPLNHFFDIARPVTTHFEYHFVDDQLLKLDLLSHNDPGMLRDLWEMTGVKSREVPLPDRKVMGLFLGTEVLGIRPGEIGGETLGLLGVPEFGRPFALNIIRMLKPETVTQLIKIDGMLHGTDVWMGNAKRLIESGTAGLDECIGTRDDIMQKLMEHGFDRVMAFRIMEAVRKGKGLTESWESEMREKGIPEWYIKSCRKIRYLFPRAHAASYVRMALLTAWYKVYYPAEFYTVWLKRKGTRLYDRNGLPDYSAVETKIEEFEGKDHLTPSLEEELEQLRVLREMYAREVTPLSLPE